MRYTGWCFVTRARCLYHFVVCDHTASTSGTFKQLLSLSLSFSLSRGKTSDQAVEKFLRKARELDSYGAKFNIVQVCRVFFCSFCCWRHDNTLFLLNWLPVNCFPNTSHINNHYTWHIILCSIVFCSMRGSLIEWACHHQASHYIRTQQGLHTSSG